MADDKEIALADYDPSDEVISPDFERLSLSLPKRAVFAFLGEKRIERFVSENGGERIGEFVSITKKFPLWKIKQGSEDICLMQAPVGAPAAVLMLERLYAYGVEKAVALGCCGAIADLPENMFFVVRKAFRDEGTSYHYLPPSRFVELDGSSAAAEHVLEENGMAAAPCVTWTTDGFFRETKEKIEARKKEGCQVVDMECAALAACSLFRKKTFAQILFTADTLHGLSHDQRGWGKESRDRALLLGIRVAEKI